MLIDKQSDLGGSPASVVAMWHVDRYAQLLFARHGLVSFHVTIKRVRAVVRAADKKYRHLDGVQVLRRIPQIHPALACVGRQSS
jgi:hypothetical protein